MQSVGTYSMSCRALRRRWHFAMCEAHAHGIFSRIELNSERICVNVLLAGRPFVPPLHVTKISNRCPKRVVSVRCFSPCTFLYCLQTSTNLVSIYRVSRVHLHPRPAQQCTCCTFIARQPPSACSMVDCPYPRFTAHYVCHISASCRGRPIAGT
ncbi:hypothetical protein DENSPDRAFT_691808 [Dentipellis sp. KUC8613]|nr:hypothetical protein DENSPDRAFT_691808 [Dentipellis sp. KUC8613]